jgi:hypothetical protein
MLDLPPATAHLVELFRGPLRDVRFPDADAERLGAAIDASTAAQGALADAEAAVEAARVVVAEQQRLLAQETEKTLAYARIYAAERTDLRAALDAIPTPASVRRGRGRPRKLRAPRTSSANEANEANEATAAE